MFEAILNAPVLLKVLCSLVLILVINSFSKYLLLSIGAGAVVLAVWSGHSAGAAGRIAWERLSSADNLLLLVVVVEVISLSSQMAEAGVMKDLVEAIRARISKRASMAVLPAVIGCLPMPGGALFSAPMVDSCDTDGSIAPLLKVEVNYWFRHIWEYWWPLYPGVLLAMEITRLEIWRFMLLEIPLTICAVAGGYWFLLRHVRQAGGTDDAAASGTKPKLLVLLVPILVVIACYAAVKLLLPQVANVNRYLPMIIGMLLALFVLQLQRPLERSKWKSILFSRKLLAIVAIIAVVRVYGAFIEAELPDGTLLIAKMRSELNAMGIPLIAITMVIPFVCGLTTGIAVGFVGASFPIVISLLGANPSMRSLLATTVLAYGFGHCGQMLSPVHVCLIVTNEHFKTKLAHSLAELIKPAAVVMGGALLLHLLIRWVPA